MSAMVASRPRAGAASGLRHAAATAERVAAPDQRPYTAWPTRIDRMVTPTGGP